MTTIRDPKKHPKVGDVLRRFGCTRHVTAVAKKASGTLINVYFTAGTPDSQATRVSISAWRSWANADCEVLLRDDTSDDLVAPRKYIALHRCGGLVATSWDDEGFEKVNQQNCRDWHAKPVPTASQYDVLRYMLDALLVLLPEIPLPLWVMADESSRETIKARMTEQYVLLPEWARTAAIDVLSGKTVKDLAANLQRPEKEVSENVRITGAILYTLRADSTIPFPSNVTKLRKLGEQLLPVAAQYELAIKQVRGEA